MLKMAGLAITLQGDADRCAQMQGDARVRAGCPWHAALLRARVRLPGAVSAHVRIGVVVSDGAGKQQRADRIKQKACEIHPPAAAPAWKRRGAAAERTSVGPYQKEQRVDSQTRRGKGGAAAYQLRDYPRPNAASAGPGLWSK